MIKSTSKSQNLDSRIRAGMHIINGTLNITAKIWLYGSRMVDS